MTAAREIRLVQAARWALRYVMHEGVGQHDDILLGRELARALEAYDDIEPHHDLDRRRWQMRRAAAEVHSGKDGQS